VLGLLWVALVARVLSGLIYDVGHWASAGDCAQIASGRPAQRTCAHRYVLTGLAGKLVQ
jgi:hypothetical protein